MRMSKVLMFYKTLTINIFPKNGNTCQPCEGGTCKQQEINSQYCHNLNRNM